MDWLDLGTWERIGADLAKLAKLAAALSRLKKSKKPKRDLKQLGDEIDDLQKSFEQLCEAMLKHVLKHGELIEALKRLFTTLNEEKTVRFIKTNFGNLDKCIKIILSHESRLKKLEESMEAVKGKRLRKDIEAPKPKKSLA